MDRFSKKSPRFLKQEEAQLNQALGLDPNEFKFVQAPVPSTHNLSPGDILTFSYSKGSGSANSFITLAVSNSRSGMGSVNFSGSGKKYYSCYLIDHLSEETWKTIVSSINKYKGNYKKVASYRYIKNLFGMFLGKSYYRTFISTGGRMSGLSRIDLERIVEEQDG